MSKTQTIKKDGFLYEVHEVKIDNGKKSIGFVEVPAPEDLMELAEIVKSGIETSTHAAKLYRAAKTIEMQRQARDAKKTGKVPQKDVERLFSAISIEDKSKLSWSQISELIINLYKDEQSNEDTSE